MKFHVLTLTPAIILAAISIGYSFSGVELLYPEDPSAWKAGTAPFAEEGTHTHTHTHTHRNEHQRERRRGEESTSEQDDGEKPRKFFRYDEAGPKPIPGTARSHALPNAVPITNIIPREEAENKLYHARQRTNTSEPLSIIRPEPLMWKKAVREIEKSDPEKFFMLGRYNWNHTYHDDYRTLYLYNPAVLPLHNTITMPPQGENGGDEYEDGHGHGDYDPDLLSAGDLQELTGGDPRVRYVAVYRAYLGCNCFGRAKEDRHLMKVGEQISYLAVALLDEALDVIEGTDVLIDLNAGPSRLKYFRQDVEDCRIFLIKGEIYLVCNEAMKRVRIRRKQWSDQYIRHPTTPPPNYGTKKKIPMPYIFPNIHGNGLEVTLLSQSRIYGGKNMNVFRAPADSTTTLSSFSSHNTTPRTEYDYYLQIFPSPHRYGKLVIYDGPENENKISTRINDEWKNVTVPQGKLPQPTFDTPDAGHNISRCVDAPNTKNCSDPVDFPFFEVRQDHGTACCVKVILPLPVSSPDEGDRNGSRVGREVMVGITHQKLSPRNNFWLLDVHERYKDFGVDRFVSRFVAYNTHPPFETVARSGWFCLGFAEDAESNGKFGSTLAGKNLDARLDLFNQTYDCPIIHFASGFSETVGNSSRAIISYGINDCHPRMFFVEKDEIVRLLTQ
eukprot:jgi/Psemu1/55869/gm1.55869_g